MSPCCNWCCPCFRCATSHCEIAEHEAQHAAQVFNAGPSARRIVVHTRQLLKTAVEQNIVPPANLTGSELARHLLEEGISLTPELEVYDYQPACLTTIPDEILQHIMSYVVALDCDPGEYEIFPHRAAIHPEIFGYSIPILGWGRQDGKINAARASQALFRAALATLLEEDIIRFEIGDAPDWMTSGYYGSKCYSDVFLSQHIAPPTAGYLIKIRHMSLEYSEPMRFEEESHAQLLSETMDAISNVVKVCPGLRTLHLRVPWILMPIHREWNGGESTMSNEHETTKNTIVQIASKLHALPIKKVVLDLDWWPDYNTVFDNEITFKVYCRAEDFEDTALATYEKYFGPLQAEEGFSSWRDRAQAIRKVIGPPTWEEVHPICQD